MSDSNWGTVSTALIAGIGIGAALGMILAPKSGRQLRGELSDAAKDAINQASDAGKRVSRRAQRAANEAAERVSDAVAVGRHEYDRAKNQIT